MRRHVGFAFAVVLLGMMIMAACTNHNKQAETPAVLDVKIDAPDHIDLNKPTKLACVVTYGGEKVDDASEVKFEVWKHGSSEREMLEAKHDGDGRYSVEKRFTQAGTYSVVAHVTARDMHNMPKKILSPATRNRRRRPTVRAKIPKAVLKKTIMAPSPFRCHPVRSKPENRRH